ncbi:hypothetical protein DL546_002284 [Coniochaeta pulveracea]|uniref:AB hydrolase-1 domain-containing protein n=1 Tax=Coniochaeta pulveracea TaxID=177199 RepID=A0A420Y036_9PEZI|nr:hypothetical protein DL546_002284 [Coniochaeta pulveracea]
MPPFTELTTVEETLNHPSYPTAIFNLTPTRQGLQPVAEGRGGPFNISWEIHGNGPTKMILIMGLGSLKSAWQRQTLYFGHELGDKYSVLVMDNRGMGDSDKPIMRYSTSEMARDVLEVLEHLGWVNLSDPVRQVHVTGISLGGMISQELALLIPDSISSLNLICTAAAIENTTTFTEHYLNRIHMLLPKSLEASIRTAAGQLFPHSWLAGPDDTVLPDLIKNIPGVGPPRPKQGATVQAVPREYGRFNSRFQRFVAEEMHKRRDKERFQRAPFFLQLIAAGWHHKSPKQLKEMGDRVGRERIWVIHGTEDGMITPPHGQKLIAHVEPARGDFIEGMGHAPIVERWEWFNEVLEERMAIGEKLDGRA